MCVCVSERAAEMLIGSCEIVVGSEERERSKASFKVEMVPSEIKLTNKL